MTKTLRCLLIDPLAQSVVEHTLPVENQLAAIYLSIGAEPIDVVRLSLVPHIRNGLPIPPPDGAPATIDVIADDEGLHKDDGESWPGYTTIANCPQPLAGKLLMVAHDSAGNIVDLPAKLTPAFVRENIGFPQVELVGIETRSEIFDHPVFGPATRVVTTPNFRPRKLN